jgi:hypothetical protein
MRAARYRLRFFTGATLTGSTYGGGLYGDGTYGMQASDSLTTAHHRLVPWPGGSPTGPSWVYREGDTMPPLEAQIIADDGVVDYTGLASAMLILTDVNDPSVSLAFDLSVVVAPNGDQRLHHDWNLGELTTAGVFRASVVLIYESGRWMSVPAEDVHMFVVTSGG